MEGLGCKGLLPIPVCMRQTKLAIIVYCLTLMFEDSKLCRSQHLSAMSVRFHQGMHETVG